MSDVDTKAKRRNKRWPEAQARDRVGLVGAGRIAERSLCLALWSNGSVAISAAQLAYMLDGIDRRNPVHTFCAERAG